ncbi:MAG: hypothetical protein JOY71_14360 [Acetobacteraceae bacterium]|nr:hypothetical protein [Acetobacteraceae bacterium]MBV8523282.1 hypothetical protein [Acetobacteraceae bacterium]MBV8589076.1 hypothetical protein [Acetobacteraceae bacterium]
MLKVEVLTEAIVTPGPDRRMDPMEDQLIAIPAAIVAVSPIWPTVSVL